LGFRDRRKGITDREPPIYHDPARNPVIPKEKLSSNRDAILRDMGLMFVSEPEGAGR
jgi:hypothetical protein